MKKMTAAKKEVELAMVRIPTTEERLDALRQEAQHLKEEPAKSHP